MSNEKRSGTGRTMWMLIMCGLFCLGTGNGFANEAPVAGPPTFTVETAVVRAGAMQAGLKLQILVPGPYPWDDENYIALYMMDTRSDEELMSCVQSLGRQYDEILPMIIVRLPQEMVQLSGARDGVNDWIAVMREAVIPHMTKHYRVVDFHMLAGNQLTSGFAIEIGAGDPGLFGGIVAESSATLDIPDDQLNRMLQSFQANTAHQVSICVTSQRSAADFDTYVRLVRELKSSSRDTVRLIVQNGDVPGDVQRSGLLLYKGMGYCLQDWFLDTELTGLDLKDVKHHYAELSKRYDMKLSAPQRLVARLGVVSHQQAEYVEAIDCFKYNVKRFKNSPDVFAAMGAVWEANTRVRSALINYKRAYAVAKRIASPYVDQYEKMKDDAYARLQNNDLYDEKAVVKPIAGKITFQGQPAEIGRSMIMNPNR